MEHASKSLGLRDVLRGNEMRRQHPRFIVSIYHRVVLVAIPDIASTKRFMSMQ